MEEDKLNSDFNERGILKWDLYYERRIEPNRDKLNVVDVCLMEIIYGLWHEDSTMLLLEAIRDGVHADRGYIGEDELALRLTKLENLGLLQRAVRVLR